jgi:phage terminase small subunit
MGLNKKQIAFVEAYLTHWNATKAAIDAGYSERSARSIGSENLTKPDIQAAIQERLAELKMGADEVLTRLSDHARGSIAPFIRVTPGGELRGFDLSDDKPLHLLHKVSVTTRTMKDDVTEEKITLELYDAQAALALLGKHHKLFVDKIEHTGADGTPLFPDFEQALKKSYDSDDPLTT